MDLSIHKTLLALLTQTSVEKAINRADRGQCTMTPLSYLNLILAFYRWAAKKLANIMMFFFNGK
jgi:hypothetical protein